MLLNALHDASTIWPAGFDLTGQGAVARTVPEALSRVPHGPHNGPQQTDVGWPHEVDEPAPQSAWTGEPEPKPPGSWTSEPEPEHQPEPQPPAGPDEPPAP